MTELFKLKIIVTRESSHYPNTFYLGNNNIWYAHKEFGKKFSKEKAVELRGNFKGFPGMQLEVV